MSKREFNPRSFYKRFQPEILNNLLGQLELLPLIQEYEKEDDPEQDRVYFAWSRSPEDRRQVSDRELCRINDLSCDNARFYLEQAAEELWKKHPRLLRKARNMTNPDLAATLYLESPKTFEAVYNDFTIDDFSFRIKREGKRPMEVVPTPDKKALLRQKLIGFFSENKEGDRKVQVEDHLDDSRFGLFIYHEDRLRYEDGFDDADHLVSVARRPVCQAMAAYYPKTSLLMIKATQLKLRDHLIGLIGEIYFDDADFFITEHMHQFNLKPLSDPDFEMPFDAGDGIGSVRIVEITVAPLNPKVGQSTFSCPYGPAEALQSLDIQLDMVDFYGVKIRVEPDGRMYRKARTIAIQLPDRWNLKDTPRDRKLAEYVERWGFMKKENDDDGKPALDLVEDARSLGESMRARITARYSGKSSGVAR